MSAEHERSAAERMASTAPPSVSSTLLTALRKVLFCSLSAPPMLPLDTILKALPHGATLSAILTTCSKNER